MILFFIGGVDLLGPLLFRVLILGIFGLFGSGVEIGEEHLLRARRRRLTSGDGEETIKACAQFFVVLRLRRFIRRFLSVGVRTRALERRVAGMTRTRFLRIGRRSHLDAGDLRAVGGYEEFWRGYSDVVVGASRGLGLWRLRLRLRRGLRLWRLCLRLRRGLRLWRLRLRLRRGLRLWRLRLRLRRGLGLWRLLPRRLRGARASEGGELILRSRRARRLLVELILRRDGLRWRGFRRRLGRCGADGLLRVSIGYGEVAIGVLEVDGRGAFLYVGEDERGSLGEGEIGAAGLWGLSLRRGILDVAMDGGEGEGRVLDEGEVGAGRVDPDGLFFFLGLIGTRRSRVERRRPLLRRRLLRLFRVLGTSRSIRSGEGIG